MIAGVRVFAAKLRGSFDKSRQDGDLDQEMREHLALLTERFVGRGMTPEEAAYAARRQFGNGLVLRETMNEMRTFAALERLGKDLRYGVRLLARNPRFAAIAFLTLGLGIGANTAIFSLVEGLLLKPLPYRHADQLVVPATIFQRFNSDRGSVAYADVLDWKAQSDLFAAVSAYSPGDVDVTGEGEPERVHVLAVEADYFRVFERPLLIGRSFTAEETLPGASRVAVLSHAMWLRRYGGDRHVLGRRLELNGVPCEVIGITRQSSTWPTEAEMLVPLRIAPLKDPDLLRRDNHIFQALARLKQGASLQGAQARLTVMGERLAHQDANRAGTNWKLHPLAAYIIGPTLRQTLLVLFGAALFVLLIACVNVANLLLVRGAAREKEVAIRNALGAGWNRLAAQFMAESLLLSAGGGLAGIVGGYWSLKGLIRFAPEDVPWLDRVHMDLGVMAFTTVLCLATVVLAGVVPAIQAARLEPVEYLREGTRTSSGGRRSGRLRGLLVISELALAIVLLTGAGLLIRSFSRMQRIDPGFSTRNLLTFQITLPHARYETPPQVAAGFEQITSAIRRIPGVLSAAATSSLPVGGGGYYLGRVFLREGQPEPPATTDTQAAWSVIMPEYFATLGIRVLQGRQFNDHDTQQSPPVVIISRSMAKQMFPGQNPLGHRIRSWRDENLYREIVGVVDDLHYDSLTEKIGNNVYVPHRQDTWGTLAVLVRTTGDPQALLPSLRRQVASVDSRLAIAAVKTMDQIVAAELARPRFSMFLLVIFGATALILAAIGTYGVMAYNVEQRVREIGIRMALGAARADVLKMVAGGAARLAGAGVLGGIAGAAALTRLMRTLLFGVSPTDVQTFALVAALLTFVALAAAYLPARRATRVDPTVTLRTE